MTVAFRKEMSKEFYELAEKVIRKQNGEFYVNQIALHMDTKFLKMPYQHIRVYISQIFKDMESAGKIKFVREEQGKGFIKKRYFTNVR